MAQDQERAVDQVEGNLEEKARRTKFVEFVATEHSATTLTLSRVNHAKLFFAAMLLRAWITLSAHMMNVVGWIRQTDGFVSVVASRSALRLECARNIF
jgi:hypothetical protein